MALIWVGEFTFDVRATPFHVTTEDETKFVPVAVSARAEEPTCADDGESVVMAGVGVELVVDEPELFVPEEALPEQPVREKLKNKRQKIKMVQLRHKVAEELAGRMVTFDIGMCSKAICKQIVCHLKRIEVSFHENHAHSIDHRDGGRRYRAAWKQTSEEAGQP